MDDREFQRRYYEYETIDEDEAERVAASVTLADGSHPAVVGLPFGDTMRYCLMLPQAARALQGIVDDALAAGDTPDGR